MKAVVFYIKNTVYGIDIMRTVEVVNYIKPNTIHKAPKFVEGVIEFRDNIIPVIDFRKRLESKKIKQTLDTRIIIYRKNEEMIGLVVDTASEVFAYTEGQLIDSPEMVVHVQTKYIQGFIKDAERAIILLDIDKILDTQESILLEKFRKSLKKKGTKKTSSKTTRKTTRKTTTKTRKSTVKKSTKTTNKKTSKSRKKRASKE